MLLYNIKFKGFKWQKFTWNWGYEKAAQASTITNISSADCPVSQPDLPAGCQLGK
jgi:hypothetical protein